MALSSDQWLAVLAQAAPLLGVGLWFSPFSFSGGGGWDFVKLFTGGAYMAATGLVVPLAIWMFAGPGIAKSASLDAIKFHGVVFAALILLAVLFFTVSYFDPMTNSRPSQEFNGVLFLIFLLAGFVLPVVELVRAIYGVLSVLGNDGRAQP